MATDQILDTPAPECDHSKGLPAGVSEKGRERAIEARLAAQVADAEWLKRPFVPKGLDKFRSTRVVTNIGDVLAAE
jgi:hypothetical protein